MLARAAKGGVALAGTYAVVETATIARVALFAHALAPSTMGALVILTTWLRLVEMATDLAIDRYVLQARDGLSRRAQAAAHGAQVARGAIGSGFMVAAAWPLAEYYDMQSAWFAVLATATVPLLRSFVHLDCRLRTRLRQVGPLAICEISAAALGLFVAGLGAAIAPGATALSFALLAQAGGYVFASHVLARRPYRLAFDRDRNRQFWRFGWPLMINAFLLYAVFQGERMVVGALLGLETLGRYGLIAQIALLPALIVGRVSLGLVLPILSRRGSDGAGAAERSTATLFAFGVLGGLFWSGFVLCADTATHLLFGPNYVLGAVDLAWIAAAAALRIQKTGPSTLLIAVGANREILVASAIRAVALAPGAAAMWASGSLTPLLVFAALGECASHLAMCRRLSSTWSVRAWATLVGPALILAPTSYAAIVGDKASLIEGSAVVVAGFAIAGIGWMLVRRKSTFGEFGSVARARGLES